jgi:predicted nucleic acid-binding protein
MKQKVYIETSVISYLTSKPSRDIIVAGHQQTTYEWWYNSKPNFDSFISQFVIDEISSGDILASQRRLDVVGDLKELQVNYEIEKLGSIYLKLFNIPNKSKLDAFHLAVAVWYNIDYLLSWNCKHIANAIVNKKLIEINNKMGLNSPMLCTPLELFEV